MQYSASRSIAKSQFVYDSLILTYIEIWKELVVKIIQITMDSELADRVDECARSLGATRSGFTREALRAALRRYREKDLEERHRAGYRTTPSEPREFKVPEEDWAWGDEAWSDE